MPEHARLAEYLRSLASVQERLREWSLFAAITLDRPWRAEELIAASDWLQREVAESGISPAASTISMWLGHACPVSNAVKASLRDSGSLKEAFTAHPIRANGAQVGKVGGILSFVDGR